MKILTEAQIEQKIRRLCIEILERNYEADALILAGINQNGLEFARLLSEEITRRTNKNITLTRIRLNPAAPVGNPIFIEMPIEDLHKQRIIVVDDVANTGGTIFYALQPLLAALPEKVEVAVLVDRKHKAFPIQSDYVGLSLATTLREHIDVQLMNVAEKAVFLR